MKNYLIKLFVFTKLVIFYLQGGKKYFLPNWSFFTTIFYRRKQKKSHDGVKKKVALASEGQFAVDHGAAHNASTPCPGHLG